MRIILGLLVLAALDFNESYLFAEPLPSVCSSGNVFRIKVPIYPDKPDSPTYDFAFQVRISNYNIAMPWVIVISGGPGFPSIGTNEGAVPLYYNAIFTDPRGSGCNVLPNDAYFPTDALTTDYLANDILTILKLSNYHYYSQVKAARSLIFFPQGVGHGPLESQLTEIGKANKFWDYAIFAPD